MVCARVFHAHTTGIANAPKIARWKRARIPPCTPPACKNGQTSGAGSARDYILSLRIRPAVDAIHEKCRARRGIFEFERIISRGRHPRNVTYQTREIFLRKCRLAFMLT